jgi:hypothetical protein
VKAKGSQRDPENQIAAAAFSQQRPSLKRPPEDQPMPRFAAAAAAVATLALLSQPAFADAAARTVVTEIVAGDTLSVQTDDTTHQGALLLNGQPLIHNASGPVGIDGIFATPARTYVLADLGENASCYRYQVVTLTGQQGAVSPAFGNCQYAAGNLDRGVLHVRLRPAMNLPKRTGEETHTFDGKAAQP